MPWIFERRRALKALLAAVGSLVALQMLTLGAFAASDVETTATVVISGALGSLIIGVFYSLAAGPLQRRGRELSAQLFDLASITEPKVLLAQLESRQKFQTVIGADVGLFNELQAGLFVLGPLIASSASTFLSG